MEEFGRFEGPLETETRKLSRGMVRNYNHANIQFLMLKCSKGAEELQALAITLDLDLHVNKPKFIPCGCTCVPCLACAGVERDHVLVDITPFCSSSPQ